MFQSVQIDGEKKGGKATREASELKRFLFLANVNPLSYFKAALSATALKSSGRCQICKKLADKYNEH